jgi:hypothetical protein
LVSQLNLNQQTSWRANRNNLVPPLTSVDQLFRALPATPFSRLVGIFDHPNCFGSGKRAVQSRSPVAVIIMTVAEAVPQQGDTIETCFIMSTRRIH